MSGAAGGWQLAGRFGILEGTVPSSYLLLSGIVEDHQPT